MSENFEDKPEAIQPETKNPENPVVDPLSEATHAPRVARSVSSDPEEWQRFHGDNGSRRKRSELKSSVDAQSTKEDL